MRSASSARREIDRPSDVPMVAPWRAITVGPEYGGYWVVAGDVDGDGEIEIVSAKNHNRNDDHFTSPAAVQNILVKTRYGQICRDTPPSLETHTPSKQVHP
jgi:hypothetical protein